MPEIRLWDLAQLALRAKADIDNIASDRAEEVDINHNLQPLLEWLCGVIQMLRECIKITDSTEMNRCISRRSEGYETLGVIYLICDYWLQPNDTVEKVFPRLIERLTAQMCILQGICLDPGDDFEENKLASFRQFCIDLLNAIIMVRDLQKLYLHLFANNSGGKEN